ncbi:hypothetical protein HK097_000276 [Rhizophlyctis rosea]|uniref:Ankyrin n=1 Tax=Rhizophlyctis rosea TaxID=64517 RepID=A0AAD5S7K1_9FUNG|nr:hypothetical protein HK097_000276 [Rhizophlyctis rosea]
MPQWHGISSGVKNSEKILKKGVGWFKTVIRKLPPVYKPSLLQQAILEPNPLASLDSLLSSQHTHNLNACQFAPTPLSLATTLPAAESLPVIRVLLSKGADPNAGLTSPDNLGTPLHRACRIGSSEITKLLLDIPGIVVDAGKDTDLGTPLRLVNELIRDGDANNDKGGGSSWNSIKELLVASGADEIAGRPKEPVIEVVAMNFEKETKSSRIITMKDLLAASGEDLMTNQPEKDAAEKLVVVAEDKSDEQDEGVQGDILGASHEFTPSIVMDVQVDGKKEEGVIGGAPREAALMSLEVVVGEDDSQGKNEETRHDIHPAKAGKKTKSKKVKKMVKKLLAVF